MRKSRLIPFSWLPAAWGLRGQVREEAEIAYYFDEPHRSRMLIDLRLKPGSLDHSLAVLDWRLGAGEIDRYTFDRERVLLTVAEGVDREVALLGVDLAHDRIDKIQHDKRVATLREEPWIDFVNHGFDPMQGLNGVYFEFDWNDYWIEYLRMNGYTGRTEDEIVEQWFADVCRAEAERDPPSNVIPFAN